MISIPLDSYLRILRSMSTEDNPYLGAPEYTPELGEKVTAMSHAVADFVDAARTTIGYDVARSALEDLVHTFPVTEEPNEEDALVAALEALFGRMTEGLDAAEAADEEAPEGK